MNEEKQEMVKTVANSLLLISAGVSALAGVPPELFNEKELDEFTETLHSFEQGRDQLLGLVSKLQFFDDDMKAQLVRELESPLAEPVILPHEQGSPS